ncbi:MAG: PBP1A family penicillin-binding protein [Limnochordaceae bacterium]|nr:PBP1A family penicillin-binding protein [Limnochordaceae bacterium]
MSDRSSNSTHRPPTAREARGSSRRRGRRARFTLLRLLLWVVLAVLGLGIGVTAGIAVSLWHSVPPLDQIVFNPDLSTILYDRNGQEITRLYRENRVWLPIREMPASIQHAIVAVEDARFYQHHGFDPIAIARALVANVRSRGIVQGGGTITQQLARNAFLTHERTLSRKLREVIWAVQIERRYSKSEILERYLNEIYFGNGAYGVEAASQLYFGHSARTLSLPEAALLAAIPRGPAIYDPYNHPDAALERRNFVLRRMAETGFITPQQMEAAQSVPLELTARRTRPQTQAPAFVDYVISTLLDQGFTEADLWASGLKIYTTLDLSYQRAAQQALDASLPDGGVDSQGVLQPQGAVVTLDARTGAILAMVGGRSQPPGSSTVANQFNRAVYAYRQPGSAMKPFVYLAALDHGFTPASIVVDAPVRYPMGDGTYWEPQNDDHRFRGPITLRDALAGSVNVVAVKLLDQVGVGTAMEYARRMGITTLVDRGHPNDMNLSFTLGGLTKGVSPLEMASAYNTLANRGTYMRPYAVVAVVDRRGNTLYEGRPQPRVVLKEETAYLMTSMMEDVISRGTGRAAAIGRPAAGKTGTTSDNTNAWFVGFTPDVTTAVWVGNDQQAKPLVFHGRAYGSPLAAAIWGAYMKQALAGQPVSDFRKPPRLVEGVLIDTRNGLLGGPGTPPAFRRYEVFVAGTEPTRYAGDAFQTPQQPQVTPSVPQSPSPGMPTPASSDGPTPESPADASPPQAVTSPPSSASGETFDGATIPTASSSRPSATASTAAGSVYL